MAMSKSHYEDVAALFRKRLALVTNEYEYRILLSVATDLATLYQDDNMNFDRTRFLLACGKEAPRRGKGVTAAVNRAGRAA